MNTKVYLVKHGDVEDKNNSIIVNLSKEGFKTAKTLTQKFNNSKVSRIISSPYLRSICTVNDIAEEKGVKIELVDEFSEQTISKDGIESREKTQERGVKALNKVLEESSLGENIIISTHSTTLQGILNYYDKDRNSNNTCINNPTLYELCFNGKTLKSIKQININ